MVIKRDQSCCWEIHSSVPPRRIESAIHAAEACPGECIFIEIDAPTDGDLDVTVDARIAARIDYRDEPAA